MKSKILISGSYGTGNVGDEIILDRILDQLKEYDITVLSQGLSYTKKNFPQVKVIEQTPSWEIDRILKDLIRLRFKNFWARYQFLLTLIRSDIFWLGGGGLLAEMVPTVLRFYIHQMKLARFFKCKVIIFGVGVGPLKTNAGKKYLQQTIDQCVDHISVRDLESLQLLKEIGVQKKMTIIPDPAYLYPVSKDHPLRSQVVINFYAAFNNPIVWPGQLYRLEKLKELLLITTAHLVDEKKLTVVYLPFGTGADASFAYEMQNAFNAKFPMLKNKVQVANHDNYHDVYKALLNCRWSITMRFHAGLLSLVNSRFSLCIDQQFKTERVLRSMNLEPLLLTLPDGHHKAGNSDIEFSPMTEGIEWVEKNLDDTDKLIDLYIKKNQELLASYYRELHETLKSMVESVK